MNNVVLIGRLTRDPDLKYLQNTGTPLCKFTLAVDRGLSKEKKQEVESKGYPTADFINITVWGKQGENAANYLAKGRLVAIQGRIQTSTYEKDGQRRTATEVVANQVQFLEWGNQPNQNSEPNYNDLDLDGFTPVDDSEIPF